MQTKPPKIHVRDTTGAGDATMAGVIYAYMTKMTTEEIGKIAACLSAIEIESYGKCT